MNDEITFDGLPTEVQFVDLDTRTIKGLVMPYGKVATSKGRQFSFSRGSIQLGDPGRVKLLMQHDPATAIGKATSFEDTDAGLLGTFKVSATPKGDEALCLADDGVWHGLSAGIAKGAKFEERDGIQHAVIAPLAEVSMTPFPAYVDAGITQVSLSAAGTEGTTKVDEETEGTTVTLSRDDVKELFAEFAAERPEVLADKVPAVKVDEAPLYRFDGKKGQRCFSADIASNAFSDKDTRDKAEQFMADLMEAAFANITSANVATLNPSIQRPDLYVPNLYFSRPIGSLVSGGTVDELTSIVLPKFSASSGMAATHTPGTEPSSGSFSTTSQTVTPVGISGRVDINREVIDQGGSPQADQIIWNEMTAAYAQILETRIVDALQALSLTDVDITGVDATLQAALLAEFAAFQFVKGGDRFTAMVAHSDLYGAVIGAKDGEGRPLFPMGNAVNNNGAVEQDLSAVRVGNKVMHPAWALATANGGPAKSFLFVPTSVYQWFSPPRRIDLAQANVATVSIGQWGYSAEFITRSTDVIQLAYAAS